MNRQSGFTLIELIVVIVILGILAATAVPRFSDQSTQANLAAAQGILGGIYSAAALQLGEPTAGNPKSFGTIMANLDCAVGSNTVAVTTDQAGTDDSCSGSNNYTCAASPGTTTITVSFNGQNAVGTISSGLCEN